MAEPIPSVPGSDDPLIPRTDDPRGETPTRLAKVLLFGRYRVIRELGRGGMGVVMLAHDTALEIPVAVKLLPDAIINDAEGIAGLRKEVIRGMALMHLAIVRTHNFERDAHSAGIVMEFIDGETLCDIKARQAGGCFDPGEILPWIEQIGTVLEYAHHEARIVHRDLKPRNIMVTKTGKVKVADFGIAAVLSDSMSPHSVEGQVSGTLNYMSPQQADGMRPSHLDDIHAFGATIYELLTGKPPFFRGSPAAILHQACHVRPPSMAARREELGVTGKAPLPDEWEEVVAACLAKDPALRPQTAREVVDRLRAAPLSKSKPVTVIPGEAGSLAADAPTVGRYPRRQWLPWILAVSLSGVGWAYFRHANHTRVEPVASSSPASTTPQLVLPESPRVDPTPPPADKTNRIANSTPTPSPAPTPARFELEIVSRSPRTPLPSFIAPSPSPAKSPAPLNAKPRQEWTIVKIAGRDYFTLENVAAFYAFGAVERIGKSFTLQTEGRSLRGEANSTELLINGLRLNMAYPIADDQGRLCVSRMDLVKMIEPILRPSRIKGADKVDTVVLDASGGGEGGTSSAAGAEKNYTLAVANRARTLLQQDGLEVVMSRTADVPLSPEARVAIANRHPRALFISIGFSGTAEETGIATTVLSPRGVPSFGQGPAISDLDGLPGNENDAESIALATAVHAALVKKSQMYDRGIRWGRPKLLRGSTNPAVIVAAGSLRNRDDARMIPTAAYQETLAAGIAMAVNNYRRAVGSEAGGEAARGASTPQPQP